MFPFFSTVTAYSRRECDSQISNFASISSLRAAHLHTCQKFRFSDLDSLVLAIAEYVHQIFERSDGHSAEPSAVQMQRVVQVLRLPFHKLAEFCRDAVLWPRQCSRYLLGNGFEVFSRDAVRPWAGLLAVSSLEEDERIPFSSEFLRSDTFAHCRVP